MGQCQGTKEIRLEKAGEIQEKSGQVCEKKEWLVIKSWSQGKMVTKDKSEVLQISRVCRSGSRLRHLLVNHVEMLDRKRPAKEQEWYYDWRKMFSTRGKQKCLIFLMLERKNRLLLAQRWEEMGNHGPLFFCQSLLLLTPPKSQSKHTCSYWSLMELSLLRIVYWGNTYVWTKEGHISAQLF